MNGFEFEHEVRAVARALWNLSPGEGAAEFINNDEIDCVCRTEELVHLIECTTDGRMEKFRRQVSKLLAAKREFERKGETVKLRIVTLVEPSPQQRSTARQEGINALSLLEFKRSLLDSRQYLEARVQYRFGSATDPESDGYQLPEDEYVQLPLTPIDSTESYSIRQIGDLLNDGKTVVLIGPFGAGKSLTVREVFNRLRRDFYRNRTEKTPIAVNLRDHWGQPSVDEVLRRHARLVGFDRPYQLVRAWNAGQLIPLLDGFDELSSPVMAMNKDAIRRSRVQALRVIQAFMRDVRGKSGILLAGRDHYFDSLSEARRLMNLPSDSIFIEVGEFSEEQAISYLRKKHAGHQLPTWLPRKPLLLGYLATEGLLEEVTAIAGSGGAALAWDQFLDRICDREAQLSSDIIDSYSVRYLLEKLATRVRTLSNGSGPLLESDLADAYKEVTGYDALEAARTLLQRLPGLTAREQEVGARSFVDEDMMEALQAGTVSRFIQDPYSGLGVGTLAHPLSEFGCSVAGHLADKLAVRTSQYLVAAREAVHRWSDSTLALDCVLSGASTTRDGSLDAQGLSVPRGLADVVDMEERPIIQLALTDCMIDHVRYDGRQSDIRFKGCQIIRLEGLSSYRSLPDTFVDCDVAEFDDRHTNAAIIRSDLPDSIKVFLVIIRKLFVQRGSGRIEGALYRGVEDSLQVYVSPVRDILVSQGIIYSHSTGQRTIWHGNRIHRSRMLKILERPMDSNDSIVKAVASLVSN